MVTVTTWPAGAQRPVLIHFAWPLQGIGPVKVPAYVRFIWTQRTQRQQSRQTLSLLLLLLPGCVPSSEQDPRPLATGTGLQG